MRALFGFAGFQIVWFASAIGAGRGSPWPGLIAAIVFLGTHLALARDRARQGVAIAASGLTGFACESLLAAAGLVTYAAEAPGLFLTPLWIITLWMAFGATLSAMRNLFGSFLYAKAAAFGAMLGPLSYLAGERFGALALAPPAWPALLALAAVWGLALPALLCLQKG